MLKSDARRLGVPSSELDDVLQETYLAALAAAARFDEKKRLGDWLYGILRRKVADVYRRRSGRPLNPARLTSRGQDPVMCLQGREAQLLLLDSLRRLPGRDRELLRLYYEEQMPAKTIARHLQRSASTVRSQIWRAVKSLRQTLPPELTPAMAVVLASGRSSTAQRIPHPSRSPRAVPGAHFRGTGVAVGAAGVVLVVTLAATARALAETGRRPSPTTAPGYAAVGAEDRSPVRAPPAPSRFARTPAATLPPAAVPQHASTSVGGIGVLVQHRGGPVPGVLLGLKTGPTSAADSLFAQLEPLRSATTDANGMAWFPGVRPGVVRLRFSSLAPPRERHAGEAGIIVESVQQVTRVAGTVVDEDGAPAAGAEICWAAAGAARVSVAIGHAGADGSFGFSLADSRSARIWARIPGRARSELAFVNRKSTADVVLTLQPATSRLRGAVQSGGRSTSGVLLLAYPQSPGARVHAPVMARSDARGAFAFDTLPATPLVVVAFGEDGAFAATRVAPIDFADRNVLSLGPSASLSGRVAGVSGSAARRLVVAAFPQPADLRSIRVLVRSTGVDADGTFRLQGIPPGPTVMVLYDPATGEELARAEADLQGEASWWPTPATTPIRSDLAGVLHRMHAPAPTGR